MQYERERFHDALGLRIAHLRKSRPPKPPPPYSGDRLSGAAVPAFATPQGRSSGSGCGASDVARGVLFLHSEPSLDSRIGSIRGEAGAERLSVWLVYDLSRLDLIRGWQSDIL